MRGATSLYTGWAGFSYKAALPEEVMVEMMVEAARNQIRVGRVSPNVRDLYERVNGAGPIVGRRWIIEHIGVYGPEEIARIRDLGLVLTSYTGRYIWQDGAMLARQLGPGRASHIAPLRALREASVHVALSTDNVPPSLFDAMHHAVAPNPRGATEPVAPDQRLTRALALACPSPAGAYLTFEEDPKGTLPAAPLSTPPSLAPLPSPA